MGLACYNQSAPSGASNTARDFGGPMDSASNDRATVLARFWSKVRKTEGCWEWTASKNAKGYGLFTAPGDKRARTQAHRLAWMLTRGPIDDGLVLDHLCRNPSCVNPAHLEPVTHRENILRGVGPTAQNARKTHCIRGHALSGSNLVVRPLGRECRTCNLMLRREWKRNARAVARTALVNATRE